MRYVAEQHACDTIDEQPTGWHQAIKENARSQHNSSRRHRSVPCISANAVNAMMWIHESRYSELFRLIHVFRTHSDRKTVVTEDIVKAFEMLA